MPDFYMMLADKVIKITPVYDYLKEYCKEYLIGECDAKKCLKPDIEIAVSKEDIAYEREKSEREDELCGIAVRHFSDEYLETLAVYRRIAMRLLNYDTLLFHGSVVALDGQGYLFTAKSGTGKSTHTSLWRELFGERAVMVNDDKPLIRIGEDTVFVYGTPWDGKHRLSNNISVPLKAICIIARGEVNQIEHAKKEDVYPLILQQTNRPPQKDAMVQTLTLLDRMLAIVPVYRMHCNMDIEAAKVAFEGMTIK